MSERPARYRLTAPQALESQIQAQILHWLAVEQARGRVAWFCRVNGGLATYGRFKVKNYILHLAGQAPHSKGYPDVHGMLTGGQYFALEVKQPGEKATEEQALFLAVIAAAGGIAGVVTRFDDVEQLFRHGSSMGEQRVCTSPVPGSSPGCGSLSETKTRRSGGPLHLNPVSTTGLRHP